MAAPYTPRPSAVAGSSTFMGAYKDAIAVTPSDTDGIADSNGASAYWRALYIGVTGDVAVVLISGASVVFTAVPAGTLLKVSAIQVLAATTTADSIIALR